MVTDVANQVMTNHEQSVCALAAGVASKITAPDVSRLAVPRLAPLDLLARGTRWCPLTVVTGSRGPARRWPWPCGR